MQRSAEAGTEPWLLLWGPGLGMRVFRGWFDEHTHLEEINKCWNGGRGQDTGLRTNLHHYPGWLSLASHQTTQDKTHTRVDSAIKHRYHTDHYITGSASTRHSMWHIKHKKNKERKTSNNNGKLDKQSSASDECFLLSTLWDWWL